MDRIEINLSRFEEELLKKLSMKAVGSVTEETVLMRAFKYFDLDASGECEFEEFMKALEKIGMTITSEKDVRELF